MSKNEKPAVIDWYKIKAGLEFKVKLLEEEVDALRSVLSEGENDLSVYTQWQKAEAIRELRNHVR